MDVKNIIEEIEKTSKKIYNAASEVKHYSFVRKNITSDSKDMTAKVRDNYLVLDNSYKKLLSNFQENVGEIAENMSVLDSSFEYFQEVINTIDSMKELFNGMQGEISMLNEVISNIKHDTDDIFSLALNASIVSSKYSHTSGVFDILANKLNEMSNFISQNLENIVSVVAPITDGLDQLLTENNEIVDAINQGYESFKKFNSDMDILRNSLKELIAIVIEIEGTIERHNQMITDLASRIAQMDTDSDAAITGSGNNTQYSEQLSAFSVEAMGLFRNTKNKETGSKLKQKMEEISEMARFIANTASNVNSRSRMQLDFSKDCAAFCNTLTEESSELQNTTNTLKGRAKDNNNIMDSTFNELTDLQEQVTSLQNRINHASSVMEQFNLDYNDIGNIVGFLKNIMKSMNLIGMLSKIESSREPEEYKQFMTISENINGLQSKIHDNIPNIEDNIQRTRTLIETANGYFQAVLSSFGYIIKSSDSIMQRLSRMVEISVNSQNLSAMITEETEKSVDSITTIRDSMQQLAEVVEKPIEGSGHNMSAGRRVDELSGQIIQSFN